MMYVEDVYKYMKIIASAAQLPIENPKKCPEKNKFSVTVILGDSIVKEVKSWKLSDEKNKAVVKHLSGAKAKDRKF